MVELHMNFNPIGPEGAAGLGRGLATGNTRLQKLHLLSCSLGNKGLANVVLPLRGDGRLNNSLTHLILGGNRIHGADDGRQVTFLLQRFRALTVLDLNYSSLGPLGTHALAPGLAAASRLEELYLFDCRLGNVDVSNLVPDGQVNRSLTRLDLRGNLDIQGSAGGENIMALASRCTNLDRVAFDRARLNTDLPRRLDLLLERNCLVTEAQALGDAPASVVFEKLVEANAHEHGLSATFLILRDYIFAEQQQQRTLSSNFNSSSSSIEQAVVVVAEAAKSAGRRGKREKR